jgi:hypothetical protein
VLIADFGAPINFSMTIATLELSSPSRLSAGYDIEESASSDYPDLASYLLGDALGGSIVSLAVTPLAMYALATVAAAAVHKLRTARPDVVRP